MTSPRPLFTRAALAAVAAVPAALALPAGSASATLVGPDTAASNWITYAIQADRAWVHEPALAVSSALEQVAYQHAQQMAAGATLFDSPNLAVAAGGAVPGWTRLGENSGYGGDAAAVAWAFVHSPAHLTNILGNYNRVGVAAVRSGSTLWVAEVFANQA